MENIPIADLIKICPGDAESSTSPISPRLFDPISAQSYDHSHLSNIHPQATTGTITHLNRPSFSSFGRKKRGFPALPPGQQHDQTSDQQTTRKRFVLPNK
jgi:hypothetical protein